MCIGMLHGEVAAAQEERSREGSIFAMIRWMRYNRSCVRSSKNGYKHLPKISQAVSLHAQNSQLQLLTMLQKLVQIPWCWSCFWLNSSMLSTNRVSSLSFGLGACHL